MGNEYNPPKLVGFDQKVEFINNPLLFQVSLWVTRQTSRTARKAQPVVPRKVQTVHQELIELRSNSAIRTVDRGCMYSRSIVKTGAGEHEFAQDFQVTQACNLVLKSAKSVAMEYFSARLDLLFGSS